MGVAGAPARPLVGIIMGSASDARIMRGAADVLDELGVAHEDRIVSAHRTPGRLEEYAAHAERSGIGAIIAGAGGAAHLPGMIASFTVLPVVGVPIMVYNDRRAGAPGASSFGGLDALLSMSEMPTGTPVAAVGVNKAANAGLLAARILAASPATRLRARLRARKRRMRDGVAAESDEMSRVGIARFVDEREGGAAEAPRGPARPRAGGPGRPARA